MNSEQRDRINRIRLETQVSILMFLLKQSILLIVYIFIFSAIAYFLPILMGWEGGALRINFEALKTIDDIGYTFEQAPYKSIYTISFIFGGIYLAFRLAFVNIMILLALPKVIILFLMTLFN